MLVFCHSAHGDSDSARESYGSPQSNVVGSTFNRGSQRNNVGSTSNRGTSTSRLGSQSNNIGSSSGAQQAPQSAQQRPADRQCVSCQLFGVYLIKIIPTFRVTYNYICRREVPQSYDHAMDMIRLVVEKATQEKTPVSICIRDRLTLWLTSG